MLLSIGIFLVLLPVFIASAMIVSVLGFKETLLLAGASLLSASFVVLGSYLIAISIG